MLRKFFECLIGILLLMPINSYAQKTWSRDTLNAEEIEIGSYHYLSAYIWSGHDWPIYIDVLVPNTDIYIREERADSLTLDCSNINAFLNSLCADAIYTFPWQEFSFFYTDIWGATMTTFDLVKEFCWFLSTESEKVSETIEFFLATGEKVTITKCVVSGLWYCPSKEHDGFLHRMSYTMNPEYINRKLDEKYLLGLFCIIKSHLNIILK